MTIKIFIENGVKAAKFQKDISKKLFLITIPFNILTTLTVYNIRLYPHSMLLSNRVKLISAASILMILHKFVPITEIFQSLIDTM